MEGPRILRGNCVSSEILCNRGGQEAAILPFWLQIKMCLRFVIRELARRFPALPFEEG